jgi:hypothetical protein
VLAERTGVDVVVVAVLVAVAVAVATVAEDEELEEEEDTRARLFERVLGLDEEDEGAAEEASARFRLRVSIQKPTHPAIRQLAHQGASITLLSTR